VLVREVIDQLRHWGGQAPAELAGREEHVVFGLPRELRAPSPGVAGGPSASG
jgi:4-hydroxy-3-methylbut-2-enyl diphosphate reductase